MLAHELLRMEGIMVIQPQGPIQSGDFEAIAQVVDPYIEQAGSLRGL